jgi:hypothetical protein
VDFNRLQEKSVDAVFRLIRGALNEVSPAADEWAALDAVLNRRLKEDTGSLCILLDRFERLSDSPNQTIFNHLRALRDSYKYQLTFITAARHPHDPQTEFAELFFAHTLWLGCLSESDVYWNVARYAARVGKTWGEEVVERMKELTWGYPALLRAVCEAYAGGEALDLEKLRRHPAVRRRVDEFWQDDPRKEWLKNAGLEGQPLLIKEASAWDSIDTADLTAKEDLLLEHLRSHSGEVCSKDDLIRAAWPEDQIYERGIRDDSLAQLVRRLRVKIEPDPSAPKFIKTVPGRGYCFSVVDEG